MSRTPSRKPRVVTVTPLPGVGGVPFVLRADDLMARYRALHEDTQAALRGLPLDRAAHALCALYLAQEAFETMIAIGCGSDRAVAHIRNVSRKLQGGTQDAAPLRLFYEALRAVVDKATEIEAEDLGRAVQVAFVGRVVKCTKKAYAPPTPELCKAAYLWVTNRKAAIEYCDDTWPEKQFRAEHALMTFVWESCAWDTNRPTKGRIDQYKLSLRSKSRPEDGDGILPPWRKNK